jgi:hypothetical protein
MGGVVLLQRSNTPNNWSSTSDPTNAFDAADGVLVGDHWYNTASGNVFVCVSNTVGAAVWRHIPRILGQGAGPADHTGNLTNTKVASVLVPAGAMGANGRLDIETNWSNNNNANNKTRNIYFGAADDLTGTNYSNTVQTTSIVTYFLHSIQNMNSAASQQGTVSAAASGAPGAFGAVGSSTVNTANAAYVVFSVQLANAGDTCGLDHYRVLLTRPDIT